MQPFANFGKRVRGISLTAKRIHGHSNWHSKNDSGWNFARILSAIAASGQTLGKIPFWRSMYRQGRRG